MQFSLSTAIQTFFSHHAHTFKRPSRSLCCLFFDIHLLVEWRFRRSTFPGIHIICSHMKVDFIRACQWCAKFWGYVKNKNFGIDDIFSITVVNAEVSFSIQAYWHHHSGNASFSMLRTEKIGTPRMPPKDPHPDPVDQTSQKKSKKERKRTPLLQGK